MKRALAAVLLAACSHGARTPGGPAASIVFDDWIDGLSPSDGDATIAMPLVHALVGHDGVVHVGAVSRSGHVTVTAWLRDGADPTATSSQLEDVIKGLALPEGASPTAEVRERGETPRVRVTSGSLASTDLRTWTDWTLNREILTQPGPRAVEICGGATAQVTIELDAAALAGADLTVGDVIDAMGKEHVTVAGGSGGYVGGGYVVRAAELDTIDMIHSLVLAFHDGAAVRLGDVATVRTDARPEPCAFPAPPGEIQLDVHLRGDADPRAVVAAIRSAAAPPPGVQLAIQHAPARFDVAIVAPDAGDATHLALAWRTALAAAPSVRVEPQPGPVTVPVIDRPTAAKLGVDIDAIQRAFHVIDGDDVASVRSSDGSTPVRLAVRDGGPGVLDRVYVRGAAASAAYVPLSAMAHLESRPGEVDRFDGTPAAIVRFEVDYGDTTDAIAAEAIARANAAAPPPASVTVTTWREP